MHLGPIEVSFGLFAFRGYFYDLTPLIEAEGPGFLDPRYSVALEAVQYNGRYWAMPGGFMSMFLMYNKKLFAEAGLDPEQPPRTWDEFVTHARALTRDRDGDGRIDPGALARWARWILASSSGSSLSSSASARTASPPTTQVLCPQQPRGQGGL